MLCILYWNCFFRSRSWCDQILEEKQSSVGSGCQCHSQKWTRALVYVSLMDLMRLSGREPVAALRLGCSASRMETPETCVLGRVAQLVAFQLSPCHIEDTCMIMVEKNWSSLVLVSYWQSLQNILVLTSVLDWKQFVILWVGTGNTCTGELRLLRTLDGKTKEQIGENRTSVVNPIAWLWKHSRLWEHWKWLWEHSRLKPCR